MSRAKDTRMHRFDFVSIEESGRSAIHRANTPNGAGSAQRRFEGEGRSTTLGHGNLSCDEQGGK